MALLLFELLKKIIEYINLHAETKFNWSLQHNLNKKKKTRIRTDTTQHTRTHIHTCNRKV